MLEIPEKIEFGFDARNAAIVGLVLFGSIVLGIIVGISVARAVWGAK